MKIEEWFAETVARCFEYSVKQKRDSYLFAKDLLQSEIGNSVLTEEYLKPFECDFGYMYGTFNKELSFAEGKTYDPYLMWLYGYVVKHWIGVYEVTPEKVWTILPIDQFKQMFKYYRVKDWKEIIEDATERYKRELDDE